MSKSNDNQPTRYELARYWLVYQAFLGMEAVLKVLPITLIWYIGRTLGTLGWYVAAKYRRLILSNLRIAYGQEKDAEWLRRTGREHFRSFLANIFSGLKFATMTREQSHFLAWTTCRPRWI